MVFWVHCFDVDFPLLLKYPIYLCNGHEFSAITPFMLFKLPKEVKASPFILVTDKHFLVENQIFINICIDTAIGIIYNNFVSEDIQFP